MEFLQLNGIGISQERDDLYIGPNVVIERGVEILPGVSILGNNYIFAGTIIGKDVVIEPGTIIGSEGFSFTTENNLTKHIPHKGGVIIGEGVRIGSNCCIDRSIDDYTRIGAFTVIDNLVHIGHDVQIGKNCVIVANTMICGWARIGDNVRLNASCTIRNRKTVGDNCYIGMSTAIARNIGADRAMFGVPARDITRIRGKK